MRKRICLADGEDPRFIRAGLRLQADGALTPVVIVRPAEVRRVGRSIGMPVPSDLAIHDPAGTAHAEKYGEVLADLLSDKRVSRQLILGLTTDPVYVAALMVRLGHVDGAVAGASRATADVIGAGLRVLGLASGSRAVTSCLLMALANGRTLAYGGWAVIPTPTPGQLADIAIQTASTVKRLTGEPPIVALLSFSTKGSAAHANIDRVREAVGLVHERAAELVVDGELQFDAAYVPEVGEVKAPRSSVAGRANVFVVPDREAENIAYEITEPIGGAVAWGPVLQGLAAPVNDLSRGGGVEDAVAAAIMPGLNLRKHEQRERSLDGSLTYSGKDLHGAGERG